MSEFTLGQTVTIMSAYGSYPVAVSDISRMTARKIILANGMEFGARGQEWGSANSYHSRRIREYREGDREDIRRQNLVRRLEKTQWSNLSDEQLIEIYKIANPK